MTLDEYLRAMGAANSSAHQSFRDAMNAHQRQQAEAQRQMNDAYNRRYEHMRRQLYGLGSEPLVKDPQKLWELLNKPTAKPVVDPTTRLKEIDKELDIIRGVLPTPKGYKIDPSKAKLLMAERAKLKKELD